MTDEPLDIAGIDDDSPTDRLPAAADTDSQLAAKYLAVDRARVVPSELISSTTVAKLLATSPFQERLFALRTQFAAMAAEFAMPSAKPLLEQVGDRQKLITERFISQMDFSKAPWMTQLRDQQQSIAESLLAYFRRSFEPLLNHNHFGNLEIRLLPPNLQSIGGQIKPLQVLAFLEEEGIPLYLVPRASIAARLLRAPDHAARRKVLNDCFDQIVEDCEKVLSDSTGPLTATEVGFALDGVGAIHSGHHAAAQALFTVTLDTLVARLLGGLFNLTKQQRGPITKRQKGAAVPSVIDDMGVRDNYVWLPVWNAHGEFWEHKGDRIPHDYSRHATVHAVSRVQYSKRNCVQALMLVTSLIGYTEALGREAQTS